MEVEEFHPPAVIDALLRGVLKRDGETAVHYAAMLMFIYGKATSSFDWEHRPFFLQFNTDDRHERQTAYRELCARIGCRQNRSEAIEAMLGAALRAASGFRAKGATTHQPSGNTMGSRGHTRRSPGKGKTRTGIEAPPR